MMNLKVLTLGPEYSYSDIASTHYLRSRSLKLSKEYKVRSEDVVMALTGPDYPAGTLAVVPIHNSLTGTIPETTMLIQKQSGTIRQIDEISLPVEHCLCAPTHSTQLDKSRIYRIYSHDQGLKQCINYLKDNFPNAELIPCSSTAQAASIVAHLEGAVEGLAICSPEAASHYGLRVLEQNLTYSSPPNVTKFAVLTKTNGFE